VLVDVGGIDEVAARLDESPNERRCTGLADLTPKVISAGVMGAGNVNDAGRREQVVALAAVAVIDWRAVAVAGDGAPDTAIGAAGGSRGA
jgi:hypothetical protein